MKAILFLAVLVIAAQSNPIHELYRGFISNLPMETELKNSVMNDGLECLHQFTWVIRLVQHDLLKGKNFMEAIKEVLYIEDLIEQKVVPQCLMTSQRIWRFFQENRGNPKLYFSSESELILFEAKMMQTLGRAVEDLIYNRGFQAGEKMADFMKFGFNMIDPELPQVEPDDSYLYLFIILEEKAIRELLPSLFKELGGNEAQINSCVSCVKDLISFIKKPIFRPWDMMITLEKGLELYEVLKRCEKGIDFGPFKKAFESFMRNPVESLFRILANPVLERLAIVESD